MQRVYVALAVLAQVRETSPVVYLRVIAGLVPARLDVATVENDLENMTAAELREFIVNGIEELGISDAAGALRNNSNNAKLGLRRRSRRVPVVQK